MPQLTTSSSPTDALRQALADIAANFSYLMVGLALWVGALTQLRLQLQDYLNVETSSGRNLVTVAIAAATLTLWYLTAALGPAAQSPAQLAWLRSLRMRNRQLALTWLALLGSAVVLIATLAALVDIRLAYVSALAASAGSVTVAVPVLLWAQRYGIDTITTSLINGAAVALVAVMAAFGMGATTPVAITVAAVCLGFALIWGGYRWWPQRHLQLRMIPRWSLLRAAAFRDALSGVVLFFDDTAAGVYSDRYRRVRRRRLPWKPISFITRAWLRAWGEQGSVALGAAAAALFTARVTTPAAGAWVALVTGIVIAYRIGSIWKDWVSAPALQRLLQVKLYHHAGLFLALVTIPALTAIGAGGLIQLGTPDPITASPWFYLSAIMLPWLTLNTLGRDATNPREEDLGFILTADGMLVPVGMVKRLASGFMPALILATLTVVWLPPAAPLVAGVVEVYRLIDVWLQQRQGAAEGKTRRRVSGR